MGVVGVDFFMNSTPALRVQFPQFPRTLGEIPSVFAHLGRDSPAVFPYFRRDSRNFFLVAFLGHMMV